MMDVQLTVPEWKELQEAAKRRNTSVQELMIHWLQLRLSQERLAQR